jgi:hypothetical protein
VDIGASPKALACEYTGTWQSHLRSRGDFERPVIPMIRVPDFWATRTLSMTSLVDLVAEIAMTTQLEKRPHYGISFRIAKLTIWHLVFECQANYLDSLNP